MMTVIVVCVHAILWALVLFIICRDISLVARASRRFAVRIALIAATVFVLIAVTPTFFAAASGNQTVTAPAQPALPGTATIVWCPANARILDGVAHGIIEGYDDKRGPLVLADGATLSVSGWLVAAGDQPARSVCVFVDGRPFDADVAYGLDRPDVGATFDQPADRATGYVAMLRLAPGSHTIAIGAVEADGSTVHLLGQKIRVRLPLGGE